MVKKFILIVVLLATTAFTVLFGDSIDFNIFDPTATPIVSETTLSPTSSVEATPITEFTATEALPPTSTPQPTATELPTATLQPTSTPTAVNTSTSTATATATTSPFTDLFIIQTGSPVFTSNFAHPTEGCAWQGVAGQVFGTNKQPLTNYIIKLTGTYNGKSVNLIGLTGLVSNNPYGPGNFEFVLGNQAIDSEGLLSLQLFTPEGQEVIAPIAINTFSTCSKNLQIINFQQK